MSTLSVTAERSPRTSQGGKRLTVGWAVKTLVQSQIQTICRVEKLRKAEEKGNIVELIENENSGWQPARSLERLRPPPPAMKHSQHFDDASANPIGNDVWSVTYNQLARAEDSPGAPHRRILLKSLNRFDNPSDYSFGYCRIVLRDVLCLGVKTQDGTPQPSNAHGESSVSRPDRLLRRWRIHRDPPQRHPS